MDVPNSGAIFTLGKSYLAENTQSYFYIKNDPIKRLISGPHQSAVICESGRLFVWGENLYGQLGIGGNAATLNNKVNNNNNNNNNKINSNNNNNSQNGDIIIKPTCVKSLKTLGLKIADIAYGNNWSVILTHSNELFFSGRSIFDELAKVSQNFQTTTIANEKCAIIRKPFRLEEFDDCLSNNEETENFVAVLAGNEHFAVMTSYGRLIAWGSNQSHQIGGQGEKNSNSNDNLENALQQPYEIRLDAAVRQFACGPESTLVLTESGNLFLTGRLNDLVFTDFVILQKNLPAAEQIIFMHISKASEIFIVTNAGSIYRSSESVRTKSLIFQRFYDYDSEENGPIWKLLKGSSFYAVLTKANKFYTTFSESGHHLKTFREISKFKNLRLLDMAVGDQHILVHGIPRSSTLSATVGPGGEHRYMSRSFVMPTQIVNENGDAVKRNDEELTVQENEPGLFNNKNENVKELMAIEHEMAPSQVTPKTNLPVKAITPTAPPANELAEHDTFNDYINQADKTRAATQNIEKFVAETKAAKSPGGSIKSRKSLNSIKLDSSAQDKNETNEKLLRPRTPYPESSAGSTPNTIKKTPLRNYSYEAAMNNELLESISPPAIGSLENIPEGVDNENAPVTAVVSSPTPPSEEDEELTVEINTTTDALDHTIVVNEIRFINNGVDVTANVKQNATESESESGLEEEEIEENTKEKNTKTDMLAETKQSFEKAVTDKTTEVHRQAEGFIGNLEEQINERVDQINEFKNDTKTQAATAINEIEKDIETAGTSAKNFASETVDTIGENIKRVAKDARSAVENVGTDALNMASNARLAIDNALNKVAKDTKQTIGEMTNKIGNDVQETKDSVVTLLQPKKTAHGEELVDKKYHTSTKNFASDTADTIGENIKRVAKDTRTAVENVGTDAMNTKTQAATAINEIEKDIETTGTSAKNFASETADTIGENIKRVSKDTRTAVENVGTVAMNTKTQAATAINEIEKDIETAGTSAKNFASETVDTIGENIKRVAKDTRSAVENVGTDALNMAGSARLAIDNAFNKVAKDTKQTIGEMTNKIGNDVQEAKDSVVTLLKPKKTAHEEELVDEEYLNDDGTNFKENNNDDERTTASVNSNHTSSAGGGNPFENNNPFERNNSFENDVDDNLEKGRQFTRNEINGREHVVEEQRGRMRQFFDDIRAKSKGISCQNEKSIQIEDEPPRYSISEEHTVTGNKRNQNLNGSKVCTIL